MIKAHSLRSALFSFTKNRTAIYNEKTAMIYLKNTSEAQTLFIPKAERPAEGRMMLSLKSSINGVVAIYEVIDMMTSSLYYRIAVSLKGEHPGEYEYELADGNGALSSGLLIVEGDESHIEYNNETTYEQYN
jgi:hypothetical protein